MNVLISPADLAAVKESLRELAVASEGKTRRTWAVVGPIPDASREELMDLGRFLVRLDISGLVVVGDAGLVHAGAVLEGSWGEESRHVDTAGDAVTLLHAEMADDDVVLLAGVPDVLVALGGAS